MENNFFKPAGDLSNENNMGTYFQAAGNLKETKTNFILETQETYIQNFILKIVSGESLKESDYTNIIGAGSMIISFDELQRMVEEGCYNFIKVEYLNPEMIIVEYEKYEKVNNYSK